MEKVVESFQVWSKVRHFWEWDFCQSSATERKGCRVAATCPLDECPHADELGVMNQAVCGCTALFWIWIETGSAPTHLVLQMFFKLKFRVRSSCYSTLFCFRKNPLSHTSGFFFHLHSYQVGLVGRISESHLHRCLSLIFAFHESVLHWPNPIPGTLVVKKFR